jgi:hypothetical protein
VEIPGEEAVQGVLEVALRNKTKLISVNPVKRSLEDYFFEKLSGSL